MRFAVAAFLALTALRLVLAAMLPLAPDEAYYWLWSRHLQAGYFDHPPMVALWIRAGTALAGQSPFGIRLLGPLSGAVGSWLIWRAGEDFFPGRQAGLAAAGLLNATLLVGVGAIVMTPDTPLFFFWTAAITCLGRLLATGDRRWWLAVGAAAGAALLAKYTGVLLLAGVGFWLLTTARGRVELRGPWAWAGLVLALLIFAPNIAWNAAHGWVSYFKQGGRLAQFDLARSVQYFVELLVGQFGLVTPVIFGLAMAGVWRARGAAPLLAWLVVLPGAVFLQHVISGRVQANWPCVLLPAACLAAAGLPPAVLKTWLRPAVAVGFACTALVYAQAVAAPFPLPVQRDPSALQFAGWAALADQAAAQHAGFITSDEYATAAEFSFLGPPGMVVEGFDRRWHYFNLPPAPAGAVGIMVTRRADTPCLDQLGTITRERGAQMVASYKICRFVAPAGSVILPRP